MRHCFLGCFLLLHLQWFSRSLASNASDRFGIRNIWFSDTFYDLRLTEHEALFPWINWIAWFLTVLIYDHCLDYKIVFIYDFFCIELEMARFLFIFSIFGVCIIDRSSIFSLKRNCSKAMEFHLVSFYYFIRNDTHSSGET